MLINNPYTAINKTNDIYHKTYLVKDLHLWQKLLTLKFNQYVISR